MKIIKKSTEYCEYYLVKSYECEICLAEYPKYIKIKHNVYNLIDIIVTIEYNNYVISLNFN